MGRSVRVFVLAVGLSFLTGVIRRVTPWDQVRCDRVRAGAVWPLMLEERRVDLVRRARAHVRQHLEDELLPLVHLRSQILDFLGFLIYLVRRPFIPNHAEQCHHHSRRS